MPVFFEENPHHLMPIATLDTIACVTVYKSLFTLRAYLCIIKILLAAVSNYKKMAMM